MARGFDSKSVTDQQEDQLRVHDRPVWNGPAVSSRRRTLELARVDLLRRLEAAPESHRVALKAALDELDEQIQRS